MASDPLSFVRLVALLREYPWPLGVARALALSYLRADRRRREEARKALPGIEREAVLWPVLRSPDRRN